MCVNCITAAEAVLLNGTAAAVALRGATRRFAHPERYTAAARSERRRSRDRATADFLASMRLDPNAVLGRPTD